MTPTTPSARSPGRASSPRRCEPHTISGAVLNYTSDTGDERVRSTFGAEKYARLVAAKRRWDPDNVFRLNQNIRPS